MFHDFEIRSSFALDGRLRSFRFPGPLNMQNAVQRSRAVDARKIDISAAVCQVLGHIEVTVNRCDKECGALVSAQYIQFCATVEQRFDCSLTTVAGGVHQWCEASTRT